MKQVNRNRGGTAGRLFNRLGAEKKKAVTALCLISVMVFMWGKVLLRNAPQAAPSQAGPAVGRQEPESLKRMSFIELPKVKGRNDVISRDFFALNSWKEFIDGDGGNLTGNEEVKLVSGDDREYRFRQIAERLNLEAIISGKNPQAFINDTLLSVGDKLLVTDRVGTYQCEVAGIEENKVFIRCGETEITLKLKQTKIIDY